ncbi:hypothetical protein [Gordonia rhizosphera]|uniref:hypothetical protein n=1 Tax=Gordonia rhizosphera TaxID=83341 RepID=UPI00031544E1|nr:hypothetical protein [Gordonia rhizosphera]
MTVGVMEYREYPADGGEVHPRVVFTEGGEVICQLLQPISIRHPDREIVESGCGPT